MAILVLICGLLILSQIFLTSLRTFTQVQQRTRAVVLAENVLNKIRAEDAAAFRAGLTAYAGVTSSDPDYPEFTIRTEVRDLAGHPLMAPSQALALALPANRRKGMDRSFLRVQIKVTWAQGPPAGYELAAIVGEPGRTGARIAITTPGPIPAPSVTAPFNLTASVTDGAGQDIPEVDCRWSVESRGGRGQCVPLDGFATNVTFYPTYPNALGTNVSSPTGDVIVHVRAVYRGAVLTNVSVPFTVN